MEKESEVVAHHPHHDVRIRTRNLKDYLGLIARGFCMGSADVVPGVSGGTMAFILGIYEELIESIRMVAQPGFLRPLSRGRIGEAWGAVNGNFLVAVLSGIVLAILTLARTLEWLLENHPVMVWSFFFGLVLASVLTVGKRVNRWNARLILAALAGAVGAFVLVGIVPVETPNTWWFFFFSGALAICAMILPGISGAFILVLLGKYETVLAAVNDRDIMTVLWVGLGAGVGIVTFAQLLGWLFRKYHNPTVALLTGLMLGSLRKVWPWKEELEWMTTATGERVVTLEKNIIPAFSTEVLFAILLGVVGLIAVIGLEAWANRADRELRTGS